MFTLAGPPFYYYSSLGTHDTGHNIYRVSWGGFDNVKLSVLLV